MFEVIWKISCVILLVSGMGVIFLSNNNYRFYLNRVVYYSSIIISSIWLVNFGIILIYSMESSTFSTLFMFSQVVSGYILSRISINKENKLKFFIEPPLIKTYHTFTNDEFGYRIDIPSYWSIIDDEKDSMLVGKIGEFESINMVIDSMGRDMSPLDAEASFRKYSGYSKYTIAKTKTISVNGKDHFCALYIIPNFKHLEWAIKDSGKISYDISSSNDFDNITTNFLVKKYFLMFNTIGYQITCPLGQVPKEIEYDIYSEKEQFYDKIISTFRIY